MPSGLVRTELGRVEFDPDVQIRRCIALVFSTFEKLGSAMKTPHSLKTHHLLLPRHQTSGLRKGELLWKEPTESIVVDILHCPAYAGAFVSGRRPRRSVVTQTRPSRLWCGPQADGRTGVTIQQGPTSRGKRICAIKSGSRRMRKKVWPNALDSKAFRVPLARVLHFSKDSCAVGCVALA